MMSAAIASLTKNDRGKLFTLSGGVRSMGNSPPDANGTSATIFGYLGDESLVALKFTVPKNLQDRLSGLTAGTMKCFYKLK
jgi:hypothetical protein